MKRLRNTLCVLSISIVVLCGFVTARDEKYVSYFLHLYSAGLFRDRNFVLHDAKAYFNKNHIVRVEMSYSCYKNLALEEARKMLCQVAMEFVDRVNSDPGLKEKALVKDKFIPRQLHLRILCDNVMGQTFETNFIREIILDRGHVTYITFKNVPEWYGISSTFHEDFDYALMLIGNRRSQDEIIDQSTVKPQILGIPGDVSDMPLRQYHELLPEAEFPIPKQEKAPAPAPLVPVLVQIIPVELFNELGIWTPPPPPPPPPIEKPEEIKPQAPAALPIDATPTAQPQAKVAAPSAAPPASPSAPQAQKAPEQQQAVPALKPDAVPTSLQPQAPVPAPLPPKEEGVAPQAPNGQAEPTLPSTEKPAVEAPKAAPEMPERLKLTEEKGEVLLSKNEPVQDSSDKSRIPSLPENQIADSQIEADEQVDLIQLFQNALDNLSDTTDQKQTSKQSDEPSAPPSSNDPKEKAIADVLPVAKTLQEPVAVVDEVVVEETKEVPFISFDAQSARKMTPNSQAKGGHTESDGKLLYIDTTSEEAFLQTPNQAVALDEAPTNNETMQEATSLDRMMSATEEEIQDSPDVEETPDDEDQDLEMPEYPVRAEEVVQIEAEQEASKQVQEDSQKGFLDFLFGSAKKEQPASPPSQEKADLAHPNNAQNVAMSEIDELQGTRKSSLEQAPNTQLGAEDSQPTVPDQEIKQEPKKGFFDFLFGSSQKEPSTEVQPTTAEENDTFDTSDASDEDDDVIGLADELDEDDEIADQESADESQHAAPNQEIKQEPKKGFFDFLFGSSEKETQPEAQASDAQEEVAMSDEDELQASLEPDAEEAIASQETAEQNTPAATEQKQEEKQEIKQEPKKGFFDFLFGSSEKETQPEAQASDAQEEVAISDEDELQASGEPDINESIASQESSEQNTPSAEQKQEEQQEVKQEPKKGFFDFLFGSSEKVAKSDNTAAEDVADVDLVAMGDDDSSGDNAADQEQKSEQKQEVKQEPKKGFFDFLFGSSQQEPQADDNAAEDIADQGLVAMGDDDSSGDNAADQEQKSEQKQEVKQEPKKGFFDFLFGSSQQEPQADDNAAEDIADQGLVAMGAEDSDQSDSARASHDPVLGELFSEPADWLDDRAATAPAGNWAASKEVEQNQADTSSVAIVISAENQEASGTLDRWYNSFKGSVESLFAKKEEHGQDTAIQEETVETEEIVQQDPQANGEQVEKVLIFSEDQS